MMNIVVCVWKISC